MVKYLLVSHTGIIFMRNRGGQASAVEAIIVVVVFILALVLVLRLLPGYIRTTGGEINNLQLNAMAQSLLTYIVTNPGNPPNWGLNATGLLSFGLAEEGQLYDLDPFKVLQLVYWDYANNVSGALSPSNLQGYCNLSQISSTGFQQYLSQYNVSYISLTSSWLFTIAKPTKAPWIISYSHVKQLLGLGNSYDFLIIITPLLNVTVNPLSFNPGSFYVYIKVTNYANAQPVVNASVTLNYFAIDENGNDLACNYTNMLQSVGGPPPPCTPAPHGTPLPPPSSFTIIQYNPGLVIQGTSTGVTNASGVARLTLPIAYDGDNYYYFVTYVSVSGLGDYSYYQYPSTGQAPLLVAGLLPVLNGTGNSIVFADPHLFTNCLLNQGLITNPGQSALGLRIIAVFKSEYGYTFRSINFTINPGRGSNSYPVPCSYLSSINTPNYAACYWNLPSTPMLLLVWIQRNSQGQSNSVPTSQLLIIPYGYNPEYYLTDRTIIFGRAVKYAPTGVAQGLVYIGNAAYLVKLYLYYRGNAYGGLGVG